MTEFIIAEWVRDAFTTTCGLEVDSTRFSFVADTSGTVLFAEEEFKTPRQLKRKLLTHYGPSDEELERPLLLAPPNQFSRPISDKVDETFNENKFEDFNRKLYRLEIYPVKKNMAYWKS